MAHFIFQLSINSWRRSAQRHVGDVGGDNDDDDDDDDDDGDEGDSDVAIVMIMLKCEHSW